MEIVLFDLEGVFTPEVWINVALKTGIDELKVTTRDEPDYNKLMKRRLKILKENGITLKNIQEIIAGMELLPGAREFIDWVRTFTQVIVVTDSYVEFAMPLLEKLGYPTCFCHHLETNGEGIITDYKLRIENMKKETVKALKQMNYKVIATGDSYNDVAMLIEADNGILFRPPENVAEEFPQFPVVKDYSELKKIITNHLGLEK
jgi:phosphoserine/homoserine phosphotransferase